MELIENLLQLLVTFVGALLSGIAYRKSGRQAYFLLLCFYGCFALGALYWTLYLLLFDTTPRVFYVSEFGWVASVIFLRILQATLAEQDERSFRCRRAWLAPAFGVPLLAFYCTFGDILSNLIWCGMMIVALLLRHSGACLCERADGRGAEYAVLPHRRAVLCVRGVSALDGGLLLAGYLTGKPHLLVRYAADACDSGAAARHEKGGGRMTYIENIFLCMVSPLLVAALCMGRRQLRFFLFCIAGMGVCLLSAYINTFLAAVCQADALAATAEIAPVVEEMMKLLPLVFYLLVFEPEGDKIKAAAITIALAFATFENVCYLIQNGADRFSFIFFRGFGTGAMHVLCGLIVGGGLAYTWQRTWLKIAGTCGLLGAAITLHAIYNLLIAYGGAAQYIAYALPVLLVAAGRVVRFPLIAEKITEHSTP